MRILRVAQKLYPEYLGGGPYHVHAMSRDQAALGHDVTVLTVSEDESLPRQETRQGYTVIRARPTVDFLGNSLSMELANDLRQASGYDVVHAHSHLYLATNLTAIQRHFSTVPLAITNHGLYSQSTPKWLFELYLRTLGKWTFNAADLVFCYTGKDQKRLQSLGVESRIAVISNGVNTNRFTPDGPSSELVSGECPVLYVGRLVEGKRPQEAIRTVARVRETREGVELYLCGNGPLRVELETLAQELGIAEAVHFLGRVEYDAMPAIYRSAKALVLPSRAEGMPRVVLEAMATGVPVVTSDLDQIASIVQQAGRTAPVGDIDSFAKELEDVLQHEPTLDEMGCQSGVEDFRWDNTVSQTTDRLQLLV
jgi:glycogen(starch) synthase